MYGLGCSCLEIVFTILPSCGKRILDKPIQWLVRNNVLGEFTKIELSEVDLCSEHYIMLADFIETMKENTHVF